MRRWARLLLRLPGLLLVLAGGALLALGIRLCGWLGKPVGLHSRQRLSRRFLRLLGAALPFQVQVEGSLPKQPMLWVANHLSWLDIVLLGGLQPLSFLSKAEVREWPLAGWLADEAGTLFIRRGAGDTGLINGRLADRLAQGLPMLMFPEGTSHDGSRLGTFHGRLLGSASQAGVPIQPVAIRYRRNQARDTLAPFTGEQELPGHVLQLLLAERGEVLIQLLAPIATAEQSRTELARQAQAMIAAALADVPPPRRKPSGSLRLRAQGESL